MNRRTPDDLPPELLAAYADGELGPHARDRVERWLADHPEGREILEPQESLGLGNAEFWEAVKPPTPSSREWVAVRDGIRAGTRVSAVRRRLRWAGPAALVATAAALLFSLPTGDRPQPQRLPIVPTAAAVADEPYAMATDDDVQIVSLPEAAAHLLVVGRHPLGDSRVVLARSDEVEFFGIGSDPDGRFPEVPTEAAPDDVPMIWAPRNP